MNDKTGFDELLAKYTDLELKYAELQTQYRAAQEEINSLKEKLSRFYSDRLPEIKEQILVTLSQLPAGGRVTAAQIAQHLNSNEQVVLFQLEELKAVHNVTARTVHLFGRRTRVETWRDAQLLLPKISVSGIDRVFGQYGVSAALIACSAQCSDWYAGWRS